MKKKLDIAVVGFGQRGPSLLENALVVEGVRVTIICDKYADRLEPYVKRIEMEGYTPVATTDYNEVVALKPDAIIVATSWDTHVAVALAAMEAGIPVAIEVGGTHSIEDCWKLVDCYEKTQTPFMFLENCCYYKDEILATSLVRNGVLGDVSYCQGSYCHDLREEIAGGIDTKHYRLEEYKKYNCENYPTHELGPIAKILNINSGNRFVRLVSMSSKSQGLKNYIKKTPKYTDRLGDVEFKQGDVTTTMIQCENGETILLKLDTTLPRLCERDCTISGTEGFYCRVTGSVVLDDKRFNHELDEYEKAFKTQEDYSEYLPDDWKTITKEQIEAGHGGMDYVMMKHYLTCLKEGRPMPIDVYDAVSWMSITALSEQSIANGSMPVECPDFTRGKYKTRKTVDVLDIPVVKK